MSGPEPERRERASEAVARPAAAVALGTLSSRVGGVARESLFAALFGATHLADAYQIAFRIPNLLRDLFAEGALSSAFVPTYAKTRAEQGDEAAARMARVVLGTLMAVTGLVAAVGILAAGPVVDLIAAGADEAKRAMAVPLARIMFPFLPLVAVAAVFMGVLNAHRRYLAPAYAPLAFNLATIAGGVALLLLGWGPWDAIVGWSVFVVVGGAAQALVQVPALARTSWRGGPVVDARFRDPGLRTVVRRMGPVALALAGTQVMILVTTAVASGYEGWVAGLQYAFRLIHLPIGLVGVALGTVSLAAASRLFAEGSGSAGEDVLRRGLRLNVLLAVPAATGLAAVADPAVRLLFERGRFGPDDTRMVADMVRWYALGVPFYAGVKVAAAAFHARGDTRTPMVASLVGIAVNLGIAVGGVGLLGYAALALATSVGSAVNYGLLRLRDGVRHGGGAAPGLGFQARVLVVAAAMGVAAWAGAQALCARGGVLGDGWGLAGGLASLAVGAGALYAAAAHAAKIDEVRALLRALRRRRGTGGPG